MILIASDGELYGHHQPFRDKFLAYLMDGALKELANRDYLSGVVAEAAPVPETIHIRQNTSWSCHHGVLRWSGVCNCTPHSEWKEPFRQALDRLAEAIDQEYLKLVDGNLEDPWELRHQYIHVIHGEVGLARLGGNVDRAKAAGPGIAENLYLLRAQYERQRMFTSCGWFFDDFDRIEPRNNVAYAAQASWLTRQATGVDLSRLAESELAKVKSWRTGLTRGRGFPQAFQCARLNFGRDNLFCKEGYESQSIPVLTLYFWAGAVFEYLSAVVIRGLQASSSLAT